jgi:cellulose synthase/poly-beta-1,6-N-acetylglucosamine synthase-like glycosyltransferase
MPITSGKDAIVDAGQSVFTYLRTKGWMALQVLFYLTTAISVLRILFLGVFVRRSKSGDAKSTTPFTPPVTVLVPAFNESKVIRRTLDGLLRVPYPNLEILVVDDGSTDDTVEIASSYAATDPRVRVISKSNGGKWSALNLGFLDTDREYVVTIDADTMIPPGTIYALIAPFRDPAVDAVCGNVQVGNVHNVLTAFQDVEYVTTQNYDRRAFNSLNCISVVPGATGAWKRAAVLNAGAYSNETLTEDADLTLTLLEKGARIVYAPDARSVTEAPETVSALFKQRFRWSFGTFQCLWKHRKSAFKGTLGWVAIPNLFLFQVVYPLLSPIGDAVFALSLLRGDFGAIACGYGLFLLMDLAASIVAFRLDHRSMGTLWVVLIQRFFYRQFMYVVAFKAVIHAFRGGRQVWNKLDRNASVVLPEGYEAA